MTQDQLATFLREVDKKTSWGKIELRNLVLDIIAGVIK